MLLLVLALGLGLSLLATPVAAQEAPGSPEDPFQGDVNPFEPGGEVAERQGPLSPYELAATASRNVTVQEHAPVPEEVLDDGEDMPADPDDPGSPDDEERGVPSLGVALTALALLAAGHTVGRRQHR